MSLDIQKNMTHILEKEMDRRDFIKHVAIAFVAITGVAALVKTLSTFGHDKVSTGYGSSAYGGQSSRQS